MNSMSCWKNLARATAGVALVASTSTHADGLYLQLGGIAGEGTVPPYVGWTTLGSAGWKVTAETSWTKGGGASVGKPAPGDLKWTQAVDTTVPVLFQKITSGTHVSTAKIQYVKTGSAGPATFMQLALTDLFFTDLAFNGSAFSAAAVYKTIALGYKPMHADGTLGSQMNAGWDVPLGKRDRDLSPSFSGLMPSPGVATSPGSSPSTERAYLRLDAAGAGESVAPGYENWIELSTAGWNTTAESSWTKGGGASVGKPNPGHLTWTQAMDKSVLTMFEDIVVGQSVPKATVEFVKDGPAGPVTYMQLALDGLFYTGLEFADASVAGDAVFKSITQTVWQIMADGTRGQSVSMSWDIPAGTSSLSGDPATFVDGFGAGSLSPALPVPEPETYVLMLAGLALIVAVSRRRNRAIA